MNAKALGRTWARLLGGALAVALAGSGCNGCGGGNGDGGDLPPDVCNSLDEALNDAQCSIPEETDRLDYISVPEDRDWFSFRAPSTVTGRSLLRVTAGYGAPATPVQLAVNLLHEAGQPSLGTTWDRHGQGAPRSQEIFTRFTSPNARLVLLVTDQPESATRPQSDPRNPYLIRWDIFDDPDPNEPNDNKDPPRDPPTPIPLDGSLSGSATGKLVTPGDVDVFSIQSPAPGRIIYFRISEATPAPKPLNYRLAWTLYDPTGNAIGEGRMDNVFLDVDLATARLAPQQGEYRLAIQAYREPSQQGPLPGDERLTFRIDVLIVTQQDANEPNNTISAVQGNGQGLVVGTPRTFAGRIGSAGDPDWFALDLPVSSNPQVLHYRLTPPTGTGRFPELPTGPGGRDRAVSVVTEVTQGENPCKDDPAICPKGYSANPLAQTAVESLCRPTATRPSVCLWSDRNEDSLYANLRNFEGKIPIPPHGTPARYYVVVQDVGNDWADDRNYTLTVTLLADPDDTARAGLPGQTEVQALVEDTSGSTFPAPPAGATQLNGRITHGYGRTVNLEPGLGQGIRGPGDYDAVPTDVDRFQLDIPPQDPMAGPLDRTWELQWSVQNVGGSAPMDLQMEVELCDGTQTPTDGGSCYTVTRTRGGGSLVLGYTPDSLASWWNINLPYALQPLWDRSSAGSSTTVTARGYGCFCFEPRFIQGQRLYLRVGGVDRNTWDDAVYTVRTAFTSYPKAFPAQSDGGTITCPVVNDAGTPSPDGGSDGGTDGGTPDAGPPGPRGGCDFTR